MAAVKYRNAKMVWRKELASLISLIKLMSYQVSDLNALRVLLLCCVAVLAIGQARTNVSAQSWWASITTIGVRARRENVEQWTVDDQEFRFRLGGPKTRRRLRIFRLTSIGHWQAERGKQLCDAIFSARSLWPSSACCFRLSARVRVSRQQVELVLCIRRRIRVIMRRLIFILFSSEWEYVWVRQMNSFQRWNTFYCG